MSLRRFAKKTDSTQKAIVDGLRKAGIKVWIISKPCDLLTLYHGRWRPLEVKPEKKRKRNDQEEQNEFLEATGTPVVRTPEEAIVAVLRSA